MEILEDRDAGIVIVGLRRGELILESLREVAQQADIHSGVVMTGIGSLTRACIHTVRTNNYPPGDEFIELEGPLEVVQFGGIIANYEPKALFEGDRANHVTYGTSSGLDAPTHNVINLQTAQTGMMSRETFLENDPSVEDVEAELSRLAEDRVRDAGLAMLLDPGLDPTSRIRAIRAFQERKSVEDVLEELAKQPPAAGMALSAQGAPVVPGGPSGTPGAEAPQQPTALPPPALLRAVGGRRPVPAGR